MPPSTCAAAAKQGGSPRRGADPGAPSLTRHSPAPNGAASPAETREPMFHVKHSLAVRTVLMPPGTCDAAAKRAAARDAGRTPGALLTRHSPAPNGAALPT